MTRTHSSTTHFWILALALALAGTAFATEPVTLENYVRAESDHMMRQNLAAFSMPVGKLHHLRAPTTPDNQPVIRMNQDTLYTGVVIDLSKPVTFTLPDLGGRYQSMHVVNQDHYMFFETEPGSYELTEESVGTRFALVTFRTFADPKDPADLEAAHAAQDAIGMSGGGAGPFDAPDWDPENLATARRALSDLAILGFDTTYAFGSEKETRPIDHLVGAAAGWGGLPQAAAYYILASVNGNDGQIPYAVTVKDAPVDAFWSITVYNADGYLEANDLKVNSYNGVTAEANDDGSHTIHFGGCDDGRINCIPITPGWNYAARMYSPQAAILDGSWTFPAPAPVN
jgi:hypothetical protein